MPSLRFLLSRRWLIFLLVVVFLGWAAWRLGEWQFHRLADRKASNAIIERNQALDPVPVTEVLPRGASVTASQEWRRVSATGTYAVEDTVVVRYSTRDGAPGVDVVVPFVLSDGIRVLVDRGWFGTDDLHASPDDVPPPPSGEVTIEGWLRQDATGDSTQVTDHSTRAVNSSQIAAALDQTLLGGFVDLRSESPEPSQVLVPRELPELNNGPHFFYGLQWWFFGALAIFGFFYLAYDEARGGRGLVRGSRRSEDAEQPAVDRKHHSTEE